jgi:GT2 family glycosyltransferase
MHQPSVCLGIVTRNRAGSLAKAIASATQQRVANVQTAVIDDGSTDATCALSVQFPQVTWIRHERSAGYILRRNELIARAGFEYFVSLDDDAWFLKDDEIGIAVGFLEKNRDVAAVAFDILSPDKTEQRQRDAAQTVATFIGCGHVLRMSAIREVGAYEVTPGNYGGEEKDLCLRLMDAGHRIVRLPGVHVWHDKSAQARENVAQYESGVCNDLVTTLRRTPTALLPLAFIVKCFQHFIFALRKGMLSPCAAGFRRFFRYLSEAWRSRRPVRVATLLAFMRIARASR